MEKYRYVSSNGLFLNSAGGKRKCYIIEIPHKRLYNTEEEAQKDAAIAFRFIKAEQILLLAYENGEKCEIGSDNEFLIKLQGNAKIYYTEQEFRENGGKLFDFDTYEEIQDTWNNIFANEPYYKLIYVDDEAYFIDKVAGENSKT